MALAISAGAVIECWVMALECTNRRLLGWIPQRLKRQASQRERARFIALRLGYERAALLEINVGPLTPDEFALPRAKGSYNPSITSSACVSTKQPPERRNLHPVAAHGANCMPPPGRTSWAYLTASCRILRPPAARATDVPSGPPASGRFGSLCLNLWRYPCGSTWSCRP